MVQKIQINRESIQKLSELANECISNPSAAIDRFIQDVEASGYDKKMAALPELPESIADVYPCPTYGSYGSGVCTDIDLKLAPGGTKLFTEFQLRDYAIAAMTAYAEVVRAQERERIAAWIETQRNDVPANGFEFAAAIRNPDTRTTP